MSSIAFAFVLDIFRTPRLALNSTVSSVCFVFSGSGIDTRILRKTFGSGREALGARLYVITAIDCDKHSWAKRATSFSLRFRHHLGNAFESFARRRRSRTMARPELGSAQLRKSTNLSREKTSALGGARRKTCSVPKLSQRIS